LDWSDVSVENITLDLRGSLGQPDPANTKIHP
jgi:hypothetical protein